MAIYLGTNKLTLAGTDGGYMINGRLIKTFTYSFNLGQTNYASLTPTTSAQNLTLPTTAYTTTAGTTATVARIGQNFDGTVINRDQHDYVIYMECVINYNYGSNNMASTIHGIRSAYVRDMQEGKCRSSVVSATGQQNTTYSKNTSYINSCVPFLYQKADNTYSVTTSQGIYHSGSTIASFSAANGADYIDLKYGTISVKAHDSYCPVASLTKISPTATTVSCTWYIYEGDRSMYTTIYDRAYELAANH